MYGPRFGFSYNTLAQNKNSFFTNTKEYLSQKVTPFLNKMKIMKKNVKIIRCEKAGENKTLEEKELPRN